jgi:hypothetical protein
MLLSLVRLLPMRLWDTYTIEYVGEYVGGHVQLLKPDTTKLTATAVSTRSLVINKDVQVLVKSSAAPLQGSFQMSFQRIHYRPVGLRR